jgi:hypothetical protein
MGHFHLAAVCTIMAVVSTTVACKARKFNASVKNTGVSSKPVRGQLDANDVSILFPLPNDVQGINQMMGLATKSDTGSELISRENFQKIIEMTGHPGTQYKLTVDHGDGPKTETMRSGIIMKGKRKEGRLFGQRGLIMKIANPPGEQGFDFSNYDMWKIVSLRLDPCAPSFEHNLSPVFKKMTKAPTTFDEQACHPQLRLIAQPVHAKEYDPEHARNISEDRDNPIYLGAPVKTSDYTMHLIYKLENQELNSALADLQKLKDNCGNITENRALGLHPCLTAQALGAKFPEDPTSLVTSLVKKYAKNFTTFAFMGTELGDDPWVFFGGLVKPDGSLIHIQNPSLMIDTAENPMQSSGKGKMRIPFGNGYYQMLTLQMANGIPIMDRVRDEMAKRDGRAPEEIFNALLAKDASKPGQVPITPVANKKRVVNDISKYLVPSFLASTSDEISKAKAAGTDLSPLLEKIGNFYEDALIVADPLKVDFFATDCMSCHMIDAVSRRMERTLALNAPDKLTQYLSARSFQPEAGYREHPAPTAYKQTNYEVVNFGHFHDKPSVSQRSVNETIHALMIIKSSFSEPHTRTGDTCKQKDLEVCLSRVFIPADTSWPQAQSARVSYFNEMECRKEVCPNSPLPNFHPVEKPLIAKINGGSFLKSEPKNLSDLKDFQKCEIKDAEIPIYVVEKELVNGHYKMHTPYKCFQDRSVTAVYIWKDHIKF